MALETQSSIRTLGDVLLMMSPFAGGSIPDENDSEYADWVRWIGQKQEEYSRRAHWRRCLTREVVTLDGETTLLPVRFHKPNGLYMCIVDGTDWMEPENQDDQYIFVEMDNDPDSVNYGRWQMRFLNAPDNVEAVIWYFANPPKPTVSADLLLLPGDMVGYAALAEYFRTANQEGSMDKAESDAENRFLEYLSQEVIPSKNELLTFSTGVQRVDRLQRAKSFYTSRLNRSHHV
jgi:hypothetical protein